MMKKNISVAIIVLSLAGANGAVGRQATDESRQQAVTELYAALEEQDAERLAAIVDFPSVRRHLKADMRAHLEDSDAQRFTVAFGTSLVDGLLETYLTPEGMTRWSVDEEDILETESRVEIESLETDRFDAVIRDDSDDEIRLAFRRDGGDWRLFRIVLPMDEVTAGVKE